MLTNRFERSPAEEGAPGLALLRRLHFDTAFSAMPFVFRPLLTLTGPSHVLLGTDLGRRGEFIATETVRGIADERVISEGARRAIEPRAPSPSSLGC